MRGEHAHKEMIDPQLEHAVLAGHEEATEEMMEMYSTNRSTPHSG